MRKKTLSLFSLAVGFLGFSQTQVYFKYDEAGNQRYRGPDVNARQSQEETSKLDNRTTLVPNAVEMDEKSFWKQVRLYPVPVNTVLTIDWNDEVDGLIASVSLYQHSTVHWKFQQKNLPNLNKQVKIDMTGYDWGVYVVSFTLKDGRVFSKNITKR